jgi:hypothetical protein
MLAYANLGVHTADKSDNIGRMGACEETPDRLDMNEVISSPRAVSLHIYVPARTQGPKEVMSSVVVVAVVPVMMVVKDEHSVAHGITIKKHAHIAHSP